MGTRGVLIPRGDCTPTLKHPDSDKHSRPGDLLAKGVQTGNDQKAGGVHSYRWTDDILTAELRRS